MAFYIPTDQVLQKRADGTAMIMAAVDEKIKYFLSWPDDFEDATKNAKPVWKYAQTGADMPTDIRPYIPPTPQTPKEWVKATGRVWADLDPYKMDRFRMEEFEQLWNGWDAAARDEYRARFTVNGHDRLQDMINFRSDLKAVYAAAPADWSAWDTANPDNTQADILALWATIKSWSA